MRRKTRANPRTLASVSVAVVAVEGPHSHDYDHLWRKGGINLRPCSSVGRASVSYDITISNLKVVGSSVSATPPGASFFTKLLIVEHYVLIYTEWSGHTALRTARKGLHASLCFLVSSRQAPGRAGHPAVTMHLTSHFNWGCFPNLVKLLYCTSTLLNTCNSRTPQTLN